MWKKKLWIAVVCLFLFAACGKAGAEKDYPAAIMVNNVIYYSTGEQLAGEVDEKAIIGSTTSYTDKMPTKNGEVNFNRNLGSKYALTEEGLVVCIDNEWILFEQQK